MPHPTATTPPVIHRPRPVDNSVADPAVAVNVSDMRTFDPWDVREPATLIEAVLATGRPDAGDVLVALLGLGDAAEQEVLDVVRVHRGDLPESHDASELLCEQAGRLVGDRPWTGDGWRPPQHVLVTVVCRTGRVVPGPREYFWLRAWRYANHLGDAYNGDVYLVTEHGWTGCIDRRAAFEPALGPGSRHLSVVDSDVTTTGRPRRPHGRSRPRTS